ncbi:copper amine oxidase N-terminal domain-containing protein [Paenibacillus odorifer]|uniref:Copper amine oxidase-like N-terminal domain-containing protein n=1 Tax=Paenibacillus odorifer TaxID=189426 RepID=A0A1R0Y6Q3_9BACL|nr:copper amine oxidase N-terminal domain-containing protein [Paenibacillus odorifer]OMD43031.1 hypothetical protein BSK52_05900 [Paenibacillus odorifer]
MRNIIKKMLLIICLIVASIGAGGYVHADPSQTIKVMVSGDYLKQDKSASMKNGRVMVAINPISVALKASVQFQSAKKPIKIKYGSNEITFSLGQKTAYVNGKKLTLDVPPQTINNTTMVPLQLLSKGLNVDVAWKEVWNVVAIEPKHAASEITLTESEALKKVKALEGNGVTVKSKGVDLLRFYTFQGNTSEYEYDFFHYVDKYTGEIYSVSLDATFESLSKAELLKALDSKVRPLLTKEPNIEDGYDTKTINGKKHYAFEVFFVGANNPYYYVTTAYVSVDAKSFYMLTKDNKVVQFSDKLFVQYMNDALK